MRLFPFAKVPVLRGYRLLRRLLVEVRGMRQALDRLADAAELQAGSVPRETVRGQVFRSYAHTKGVLKDREVEDLTEVSYVDNRLLGAMLAKEDELRAILGRDPTPEEIMRAYEGNIE